MVRRVTIAGAPEPADPLAERTFDAIGIDAAAQAEQAGQAEQAEQAERERQAESMRVIEAGVQTVIVGALKMLRAYIARSAPAIRDEWSDTALAAPAQAAIPLLRAHLQSLMLVIGANAELMVFALACAPLAMGYLRAVERSAQTVDVETVDQAPDGRAA